MIRASNPRVPMSNIVFATDFLESSRLALDYAVAFAHHSRAKLIIVHAFQLPVEAEEVELLSHRPSISREHATTRLQAFESGVRRLGVSTEIDLRTGDPCAAVLSSAVENKADLLVLGTHGVYRGLQHVLVGSNAERILLSAPCPTLTVGRHVMAGIDLHLNFRRVLFVSDVSTESVAAALYAESLGKDLGIPIELHPVSSNDATVNSDHVHARIERFCDLLRCSPAFSNQDWCDPAYYLSRVAPAQEVIQRATLCTDGVLVLGVQSDSGWRRHLHTSFAFELVARSSCPVLSLHQT